MQTKTVDYGFNLDKMPRELARTEVIADKRDQVERFAPLREVARNLSRRGLAATKAELFNNALAALADLCMEWETTDRRANVDLDGRLLVPVPWGDSGYKVWGLRVTEARILRRIMLQRAAQAGALWYYDVDGRCWLWNLEHRKATAISYLTNHPVTVSEYLSAYDAERTTWTRGKWGK